ncbi:MAG: 50S ribosomal protein L9 [Clostridiales bacterium]|nr:50S ribosomal protein L9 [Clostridiales bacterium]
MKLILTQDVKKLGKKGELINAADGYARNFLIPKGLAVQADAAAMNDLKNKEKAKQYHLAEEKKAAENTAKQLQGKTFKIAANAGANGKLFGSVTPKDIAAEILKQTSFEIDKRKIVLAEDIKQYGTFTAEIKVYPGISANIYIQVVE